MARTGTRLTSTHGRVERSLLRACFSDAESSPHPNVAKPYRAGPFQLRKSVDSACGEGHIIPGAVISLQPSTVIWYCLSGSVTEITDREN